MLPALVLAVVEINDPMLLWVAAIFILTFVIVCAVAYVVLARGRRQGDQTTWELQVGAKLPVTAENFARAAEAAAAAVAAPDVGPATRASSDGLDSARRTFVRVYRAVLITAGLLGVVGGGLLLRSHTPANMNGLPGAIVLLVALGVLLKGLVPGPSVQPIEPLDPELLRQMREEIRVRVTTGEPIAVTLEDHHLRRVSEMLRRGSSPDEALRAVYPGFDALSDSEKRWLESTIAKHVRNGNAER